MSFYDTTQEKIFFSEEHEYLKYAEKDEKIYDYLNNKIKYDPKNPTYHQFIAKLFLDIRFKFDNKGDRLMLEQSLKHYEEAIKHDDNKARHIADKAKVLYLLGNKEKSIDFINNATKLLNESNIRPHDKPYIKYIKCFIVGP